MKHILRAILFGVFVTSLDLFLIYLLGLHDLEEISINAIVVIIGVIFHFLISFPAMFFVGKPILVIASIFMFWSSVFFLLTKSNKKST